MFMLSVLEKDARDGDRDGDVGDLVNDGGAGRDGGGSVLSGSIGGGGAGV